MRYLLQHLLIDSAKKYPDKIAAVYNHERITYGELDKLTNNLAIILKKNGIKKGDRVGIYLSKSIASVISIHGILKAGGVYVPLDSNAPAARTAYIIRNCAIGCLLTSTQKIKKLNKISIDSVPLNTIVLMDDSNSPENIPPLKVVPWHAILAQDGKHHPQDTTIETDLAYILYTSGSTGTPKGVMISHLNAMTFVNWGSEAFDVTTNDTLSSHAPLHFDLSIFDIFVTFKAGATLALVPEIISYFPVRLASWIETNEISVWYSVPSILSMLVEHCKLNRHQFPKLRAVLFAGEVFPVKYLRKLMEIIPHPEYYNLYGPTETNVITYYQTTELPPDQIKPIPIGKACANSEVFALTEKGALVSTPGEEGELFARGSCVAQGYWGDKQKTSLSFVTNHIQPHFHEKIYKTGDIVTIDKDNNYLYIGRRDHMIKSRGYRIELGEIESVLYSHPEVKEAAVIAIPDELIGNRIQSFVVLDNHERSNLERLYSYCLEKLPKYMVPESINITDQLPKTSTGKIDRQHLLQQ